jgi:hypothetical protein
MTRGFAPMRYPKGITIGDCSGFSQAISTLLLLASYLVLDRVSFTADSAAGLAASSEYYETIELSYYKYYRLSSPLFWRYLELNVSPCVRLRSLVYLALGYTPNTVAR